MSSQVINVIAGASRPSAAAAAASCWTGARRVLMSAEKRRHARGRDGDLPFRLFEDGKKEREKERKKDAESIRNDRRVTDGGRGRVYDVAGRQSSVAEHWTV